MRVVQLGNADAGTVANTLGPIYQQRSRDIKAKNASYIQVSITPEPITNALLVVASDEDFKAIEAQAKRMDTAETDIAPVTVELKYADPTEVRTMIEQMFGAQRRSSGSSRAGK